jgi:hypothetical protein
MVIVYKAFKLNGACDNGWCYSPNGSVRYHPFGVSYSGATYKYTVGHGWASVCGTSWSMKFLIIILCTTNSLPILPAWTNKQLHRESFRQDNQTLPVPGDPIPTTSQGIPAVPLAAPSVIPMNLEDLFASLVNAGLLTSRNLQNVPAPAIASTKESAPVVEDDSNLRENAIREYRTTTETKLGRQKMDDHLDMHFRQNSKVYQGRGHSRSR